MSCNLETRDMVQQALIECLVRVCRANVQNSRHMPFPVTLSLLSFQNTGHAQKDGNTWVNEGHQATASTQVWPMC